MRAIRFLLVAAAVAACLVACPRPRADDQKEKAEKKAQEDEKALAELERSVEKEPWAMQRKQSIAELTKELAKAERMEVFRLKPRPLPEGNPDGKPSFHGYEILLAAPADTGERRKEVTSFLGKALHWDEFRKAFCFNPRHGLRIVSGKRTLDFLLCFECFQVRVYEGEQVRSSLALARVGDNPIEEFLRDVEKKAKERP
jgi:hypothetical protein